MREAIRIWSVPAGQRSRYEAAFATFCSVFPDMFYMQERGRNYFDMTTGQRPVSERGVSQCDGLFPR